MPSKDEFPCETQQSKVKRQIALLSIVITNQKTNCLAKCSNHKSKDELSCETQQIANQKTNCPAKCKNHKKGDCSTICNICINSPMNALNVQWISWSPKTIPQNIVSWHVAIMDEINMLIIITNSQDSSGKLILHTTDQKKTANDNKVIKLKNSKTKILSYAQNARGQKKNIVLCPKHTDLERNIIFDQNIWAWKIKEQICLF